MPVKQTSRSKGFRKSTPKVKTGCSTCKARRIKCDETRPNCLRCARFGRQCAGYESDKPAGEPKPLPEPESTETALVPIFIAAYPSKQLFENEQEASYFRYYCDEAVSNLAGVFELPCWGRVILQASHDQDFIRHAVIAIGSFTKSLSTERTAVSQCSSPAELMFPEGPRMDEDFALRHYSQFLNGSRKALAKPSQGRRMALIVCLLIICVEGLQWHHRSVVKHLISGINLLDEWTQQNKRPLLPDINPSEPDVMEDEIVQQLRMLELEASVLYNPKPREYHERLRKEGSESVNNMPDTFSNTHEARTYLELIMRRSHHFLGTVVPQKPSPSTEAADPDTQSLVADFNTFLTFGGAVQPLQFEQERYAAELRRWTLAFQSLFESGTPEQNDFLSTQLLKIRSRVLGILLAGELSTSEMIYDNHLSEFEEILRLAKIFFAHPCADKVIPEGSYSSNAGLIFPLRLVADRSRSRSMRREAIGLLRSKTWREASFWSTSTAQTSEWLMELEEEGVEGEHIPEWARARLVKVEFDEGKELRRGCWDGTGDQGRQLGVGHRG
ncbi:Aspercryptin biosynthesis cluster-specific transcription regulator atnN [Hyphodiscus hymeniophilus]|uniref:Aspercryptin biosynthesis cluster-specific transcription regulator atnN n=1 Tax=Hyphodiscus hymeniophilus TaxID=353542 RepID=A0A9P7AV32_9HELO|nr:Aspercryptin biosynthesis cluster-specific transcription regulator atnN [Hyphodiscus hymeniophilus]